MPRGRPARGVPCENCIRRASSQGQTSDEIDLCEECISKLHQLRPVRPEYVDPRPVLEHYSRQFIEAINARDFVDHQVWTLLAPDVQGIYFNSAYTTTGPAAHLNALRSIVMESPAYHLEILGATSTVDEQEGSAEVRLAVSITGRPVGVETKVLCLVRWRRLDVREGWRVVCRVNA